jgi:hypothetical protein
VHDMGLPNHQLVARIATTIERHKVPKPIHRYQRIKNTCRTSICSQILFTKPFSASY